MPFFQSTPRYGNGNMYSIRNVMDVIPVFNAAYEAGPNGSVNNCNNIDKALWWRKYVRESSINSGSTPVDLDFFEAIAGGKTQLIPAKEMTFRQSADFDRNIFAKTAITAGGPGQDVWFTLARTNHSINGTQSYPTVGYEIFIYEDMQWVRVMDVNIENPFAHKIKVRPKNAEYTANIRVGKKMLVSPATQVGGYTCNNNYATELQTPGYFYKVNLRRTRVQWKVPVDITKGYTDILQFGIMFNNEGKEIDCWTYYAKLKAMENLKYAQNLDLFMGQKISNASIFTDAMDNDTSYPGFDGYHHQVANAGGTIMPYDREFGLDPDMDFAPILLQKDSLKRQKEFTILHSMPWKMAFDRGFHKILNQANGPINYETFRRAPTGMNMESVSTLGISSLNLWGLSLHFRSADFLSDSRSIGNDDMPWYAYMMPSANLKDSSGRTVPPIELFTNYGCAEDGQYEEHDYDSRNERSGCEEVGGWMSKAMGMVVHGIQDHIMFKPRRAC